MDEREHAIAPRENHGGICGSTEALGLVERTGQDAQCSPVEFRYRDRWRSPERVRQSAAVQSRPHRSMSVVATRCELPFSSVLDEGMTIGDISRGSVSPDSWPADCEGAERPRERCGRGTTADDGDGPLESAIPPARPHLAAQTCWEPGRRISTPDSPARGPNSRLRTGCCATEGDKSLKVRPLGAEVGDVTYVAEGSSAGSHRVLVVLITMCAAVVTVALAVLAFAVVAFHIEVRPVLTGSMVPTYGPGSLLVTKPVPVTDLHKGMIVLFVPPGERAEFAHRITSVSGSLPSDHHHQGRCQQGSRSLAGPARLDHRARSRCHHPLARSAHGRTARSDPDRPDRPGRPHRRRGRHQVDPSSSLAGSARGRLIMFDPIRTRTEIHSPQREMSH